MIKLFRYLKPYMWAVVLAPLFMLLEVVMDLMQPRFLERIIDVGLKNGDMAYIFKTGLLMIFAAFLGMVGGGGCVVFSSIASQNFAYDLRCDLFRKVMSFSFKNVDRFRPETLITRLTNDVMQMQNVVMMMLRIVVRAPLLFIGGLVMALTINVKLSLVLFVSIPFVILIFYFMIKKSFPMFSVLQNRIDRVNAVMRENLLGSRVVKAFVRHEHEKNRFYDANQQLLQTSLKAFGFVVISMPLFGLVMNMAMIGVVWFGGFQVKFCNMEVGQLMAFINYTMQILFSLMMIGNIFLFITRASASAERINEVLECEIDIRSKKNALKTSIEFGKVEFRNVTFYYNENEENPTLENISFVANPGEVVGIIGTTGAGKSTLVSLIPRLYDATYGEVLIDDINVKDYDVNVLRKSISMVLQETILFTGSLKENIAWGNEDASMEEIVQAAKVAQAHDFIMSFEKGYDTDVSERGVNLSGGQKQRISIARAVLKRPKILILDDCTSAVDMVTEKKIQAALKEYIKGTTTFIIAQRISSIKHADKILVMDAGKIVAMGTHEELLKNCPIYQEIYFTQMGEGDEKVPEERNRVSSSFQPPAFGPGPALGRGAGHRFSGKSAKPKNLKNTLKRLWKYFEEYKLLLIGIFLLILISSFVQILSPLLIQKAIDQYIVPKKLGGLFKIVVALILLHAINFFFVYIQGYGMMLISQKSVFKMRNDLFSKLQRIPIKIFDSRAHGDLMSRLTNDIDVVSNTLSASLTSIFSSIITLTGSIVVMLKLNIVLTGLTLLVVPLMFGLTNLIAQRTRKLFSENQKLLGNLNSVIEEDITGQKVIKVFTRENKEIEKSKKINREFTQVGIKAQIFSGVIPPLMNLLNNLAFIIVAASGGFLALKGFITVGTIASFIQYARQFTRPLNELANQFNQIQSAFAAAERVFEIMDEEEEKHAEDEIEIDSLKGEVEFKNVWFSYNKGQPVLKDISFHVKPGQMVALVGPTGSGKTTIVNLLTRFYDIDSGQILIDGIDIRKISRESLRKNLGIVLQDTYLFSEPVKENIRYGKLSATDDEVIMAAKTANAHDFIRHLPHGYDTVLTDGGADLSQGQRQLLALARAILSDPAILILDEATSNIDTRTEKLVEEAMLKLMQGRTSFVIAHRLSTIRNADLILVIYNGRIIEQGTHEELLARKGFYYNLYMSQFAVV